MQIIHTDKAPAAVGPYSQAIVANGIVYTSGQIAINPAAGKIVATDIEGQAEQCCKNLEEVLKAAGTNFSNVIKTTCFLAEIAGLREIFCQQTCAELRSSERFTCRCTLRN